MALSPAATKFEGLPSFPVESVNETSDVHSKELSRNGPSSRRAYSRSYGGTQMLLHPSVDNRGRVNYMGSYIERDGRAHLYGGSGAAYPPGIAPKLSRVPFYMHPTGQLAGGGMIPAGLTNPMVVAPSGAIPPQMMNMQHQAGNYSMIPASMALRHSTIPGATGSNEGMRQSRMTTNEEVSCSPMNTTGLVENSRQAAPPRYPPHANSLTLPYYGMEDDPRAHRLPGGYFAANALSHDNPSMSPSTASALKGYYEGLAQSTARHQPPMMLVPSYPSSDPSVNYSSAPGGYYGPVASPSVSYPYPHNIPSNAPVLMPGQTAAPALVTVVDGQAYAHILSPNSDGSPMNPITGHAFPPSMLPMGAIENLAELNTGAYNSNLYPTSAVHMPHPFSDPRYNQYMQAPARNAHAYGQAVSAGKEAAVSTEQYLNGGKPKNMMKEYAIERLLSITQVDAVNNTTSEREINLVSIHKNPSVIYMENFLTPEECQHVINRCEGRLVPSKTSKGLESDMQV
ncbi:hypothetical protein IE077_004584 [Cardiosporidium cionae]|uniref:Uncharacterized protein n=1 Tax=Cardiosporidium cionae TaxID=476202 RepID=A0ABQ7JEX9_9APIC|nr:hypothetical protein IE077_004584 [Cardiosporidium cionae]|eukprot:KAF8822434.1 hypothetical protein IE077_004584 [Cardiosporidium cionae]